MATSDFPSRSLPTVNPTVSVVIPTHNRAQLLPRALESVFGQTFADLEVLVVDDGSTDDTSEVIAKYDDPRVRYLVQPENRGVGAARNRGFREARGDFIALLDSDDEWMPEKLEAQVALLRAAEDKIGAVYTGVELIDITGQRHTNTPHHRGDLYNELLLRNVIHGGGSNLMLRRGVIADVGYFDEEIPAIEDYEFFFRISQRFHIDFVEEPLVRVYDAWGLARKSLNFRENREAREFFYEKHRDALERAGVAARFRDETEARYASSARVEARRNMRRKPLRIGSYLMVLDSFLISLASLGRRGRRWVRARFGNRGAAVEPTSSDRVQHGHAV